MKSTRKQKRGVLRLGLSGIVLPGPKSSFPEAYQQGSRLHYYASIFNTVEINSSFYKVPMQKTFEKWAADVPDDFQFTTKLWREITHGKGFELRLADIDFFMQAADGVGAKKGCLLIQFPASITVDYFSKVEVMLDRITHQNKDNSWRIALEFRHASWYIKRVYALLDRYGATTVLHDMPKGTTSDLNNKGDFVYLRFHGPTGNYKGSYDDDFLCDKASEIKDWLRKGKDVYAYFNNTAGDAFTNALMLHGFCGGLELRANTTSKGYDIKHLRISFTHYIISYP